MCTIELHAHTHTHKEEHTQKITNVFKIYLIMKPPNLGKGYACKKFY